MQKITFSAEHIESADIELRCSDTTWIPVNDSVEYHDTSEGPQIVGTLRNQYDGRTKLGMWYKNGEPAVGFDTFPTLEMWKDVPVEDTRNGYVNIYASDENEHGWTVGRNTYANEADAIERGLRNNSGNYIGTFMLTVDINKRDNA